MLVVHVLYVAINASESEPLHQITSKMKLSERIAKSEAHIYLTRLYARGWSKKSNQAFRGGNIIRLERNTQRGIEVMHVKFCDNGWVTFY